MFKGKSAWLAAMCLLAILAGCAEKPSADQADYPPTLGGSDQTLPSPEISSVASRLGGDQDWQKVCLAMRYVGENLAYDPAGNGEQFKRTAGDLFRDETLDGCSDFALADMALFKAMGFPTRLVLTVNLKWIERLRQNSLASGNGHSFVEVFIDGRWHLADPTEFILYDCYDPSSPYLPGGEIFMARGDDFQTLGIHTVDDANSRLRQKAAAYQGGYTAPNLCQRCAIGFDFPATFTKLGGIFMQKGLDASAMRLFNKAIEVAPDFAPAYLSRARLNFKNKRYAQAAGDTDKVLSLTSRDPEALALLDRICREASASGAPPAQCLKRPM